MLWGIYTQKLYYWIYLVYVCFHFGLQVNIGRWHIDTYKFDNLSLYCNQLISLCFAVIHHQEYYYLHINIDSQRCLWLFYSLFLLRKSRPIVWKKVSISSEPSCLMSVRCAVRNGTFIKDLLLYIHLITEFVFVTTSFLCIDVTHRDQQKLG